MDLLGLGDCTFSSISSLLFRLEGAPSTSKSAKVSSLMKGSVTLNRDFIPLSDNSFNISFHKEWTRHDGKWSLMGYDF